jgi:hypothetical protein
MHVFGRKTLEEKIKFTRLISDILDQAEGNFA